MSGKERFIEIYQTHIRRQGAQRLLDYLQSPASDFFEAPASTRFHGAYKGGLVDHSLNVYDCLKDYLSRERVKTVYGLQQVSEETIAVVALLHDLCKINVYHPGKRNVKINGEWQSVDTFEYSDTLPYGHGEKSVYMITGFMRLSRDESFAIRYHMGFSSEFDDPRSIGYTFEHFPLAFALSTADMEATYFMESK
ncbi:MAG TPA: HD domain-containing protein [Candidatus Merdibacter merdavium]|uniref:HD domain-containing protein n=1 Tax=Candidatus Merdibacter merdavium TaxID=2838692 RepID=A0A9D2NQ70_9FIRM|nr:HD domain-containing protein [Candidatus Merdibacter merdavium]